MKTLALSFALVIATTSASASVAGGPPLQPPTFVEGTCIHDAGDPFEPNFKVPDGPMKGLCVSPVQRRSAKILTDEEAAPYFQKIPGTIVIANFAHLGKFWLAQIPVEKAKQVILQVQYFPLKGMSFIEIAHTQLRFEFEDGATINLVSQSRTDTPARLQLKRLLFSVENIGPYGEAFDAVKGLKGYYQIAYRAVSLDDKYQWMVAKQGHTVKQFLLNLSPANTSRLLNRALAEADHWGYTQKYHTLNPNCVTELFRMIDDVLGLKHFSTPEIPNFAISALKRRGLIDPKQLPTLNEEYGTLN
jgi:hypothetical protein